MMMMMMMMHYEGNLLVYLGLSRSFLFLSYEHARYKRTEGRTKCIAYAASSETTV